MLLLRRSMAAADVVTGLTAALEVGAVSADVVAVEARALVGPRAALTSLLRLSRSSVDA